MNDIDSDVLFLAAFLKTYPKDKCWKFKFYGNTNKCHASNFFRLGIEFPTGLTMIAVKTDYWNLFKEIPEIDKLPDSSNADGLYPLYDYIGAYYVRNHFRS